LAAQRCAYTDKPFENDSRTVWKRFENGKNKKKAVLHESKRIGEVK
jgi:hypothetical protein